MAIRRCNRLPLPFNIELAGMTLVISPRGVPATTGPCGPCSRYAGARTTREPGGALDERNSLEVLSGNISWLVATSAAAASGTRDLMGVANVSDAGSHRAACILPAVGSLPHGSC